MRGLIQKLYPLERGTRSQEDLTADRTDVPTATKHAEGRTRQGAACRERREEGLNEVSRKTAKQLAVRRKNEGILPLAVKKNVNRKKI